MVEWNCSDKRLENHMHDRGGLCVGATAVVVRWGEMIRAPSKTAACPLLLLNTKKRS